MTIYDRTYYSTQQVASNGIHFNKCWEIPAGAVVDIMVYDIDDPQHYIHIKKSTAVSGAGSSVCLDRKYGFKRGDLVVVKLKVIDTGPIGAVRDD